MITEKILIECLFQSTSIKEVKDINQSLMILHTSSVNIICHPIVNIDGSINIASNILSKC